MNSNQKSTGVRGVPQAVNGQAEATRKFKPAVAQRKSVFSAQSIKQPVAPPVYRPQPVPKVLQTKSRSGLSTQAGQAPRQPVAPPVYRPQAKPVIAQAKAARSSPVKKHSAPHLRTRSVQLSRDQSQVVQRCVKCRKPACKQGELCGYDPTFGGLFEDKKVAVVVPYKQARKYPSGGKMEFEHPIAGKALKLSGVAHDYRDEFTIQTPKVTHRAAQSGGGGGITSTGSSDVAREWAKFMGKLVAGSPSEAVRLAAVEQINAHWEAHTLNEVALNGVLQWIEAQKTDGRITALQAGEITKHIVETAYARFPEKKKGDDDDD